MLVDPCSIEAIRDGFLALIRDAAMRARLVAAGRDNARRYTLKPRRRPISPSTKSFEFLAREAQRGVS